MSFVVVFTFDALSTATTLFLSVMALETTSAFDEKPSRGGLKENFVLTDRDVLSGRLSSRTLPAAPILKSEGAERRNRRRTTEMFLIRGDVVELCSS